MSYKILVITSKVIYTPQTTVAVTQSVVEFYSKEDAQVAFDNLKDVNIKNSSYLTIEPVKLY